MTDKQLSSALRAVADMIDGGFMVEAKDFCAKIGLPNFIETLK